MPKGRHIIHYKQKRAAHWAARFFAFMGFCYNHIHSKKKLLFPLVKTGLNYQTLWGTHGEARSGGSFVVSGMGHALRS